MHNIIQISAQLSTVTSHLPQDRTTTYYKVFTFMLKY